MKIGANLHYFTITIVILQCKMENCNMNANKVAIYIVEMFVSTYTLYVVASQTVFRKVASSVSGKTKKYRGKGL